MRHGLRARVGPPMVLAVSMSLGLGCASAPGPSGGASPYPQKVATAGAVDVEATPTGIGADGAAFDLSFDSHSATFDQDPARAITLDVAGKRWPATGWDGDPPSGHHRELTVRFAAAGPVSGDAVLTISGLQAPVQLAWPIGTS